MRQHTTRLHLPLEHIEKRRLGWLLLFAQQIRVEHRPMKGHEACITADRQVQRGDVAVADERFGVAAQQVEVDAIKQSWRSVTATKTDDRIDLAVGECGVQVSEPHFVATGQVAVPLVHAGIHPQRITASAHPGDGFFGVQRCGSGGCDDTDQPLRRQGRNRRVRTKRVGGSNSHP
ncbi:hypothetical protein D3C84_800400 [compost metagenome]